jgi:hypothetical protein
MQWRRWWWCHGYGPGANPTAKSLGHGNLDRNSHGNTNFHGHVDSNRNPDSAGGFLLAR